MDQLASTLFRLRFLLCRFVVLRSNSRLEAALQSDNIPQALNFGPNEESLSVSEIIQIAEEYYQGKLKVEFSTNSVSNEEDSLDLDSGLAYAFLKWQPKLNPRVATIWTLDWWEWVIRNQREPLEACKENLRMFLESNQSDPNS